MPVLSPISTLFNVGALILWYDVGHSSTHVIIYLCVCFDVWSSIFCLCAAPHADSVHVTTVACSCQKSVKVGGQFRIVGTTTCSLEMSNIEVAAKLSIILELGPLKATGTSYHTGGWRFTWCFLLCSIANVSMLSLLFHQPFHMFCAMFRFY
jgi:hypothetical protein